MGRHGAAPRFRLLFVCTGNICRSPFAEILGTHLLASRLSPADAARFEVASAGVSAVVGSGMHPETRNELTPWGLDGKAADRFVARQLEAATVAGADLVLGAGVKHRGAVVKLSPQALPVAFSLLEFARLAESVEAAQLPAEPVERAHALVGRARSRRGVVPPVDPGADDVPDPIGQNSAAHRDAAMLIHEALATIIGVIAPAPR